MVTSARAADARSWLVLSNYVLAAQGAVSGPIVARLLGPDGRGQSAALQTSAILAATLAGLGLTTALNGRAAAFGMETLVGATRAFRPLIVGLSFLILPALFVAAREVSVKHVAVLLLLALPAVLGNYAAGAKVGILIAAGYYRRVMVLRAVGSLALIISLIAGSFLSIGVVPVTAIYLITGIIPGLAPLPRTAAAETDDVVEARRILRHDLPALTAQGILNMSNARADQAILPLALSNRDLGLYSVGVTYGSLTTPLNSAMAVIIMRRMGRGGETSTIFPWRAAGALTGASVLLAANAFWVITLLFGRDFKSAVIPAVILCFASAVTGLSSVMAGMLVAAGRTNKIIVGEVLTLVLLPLTLPISAAFGPTGAAAAAALSYLANFFYLVITVITSRTVKRQARPADTDDDTFGP